MRKKPGYMGKIATVDLSTGNVTHIPTEDYSQDFVGGQGIAAKIYWDRVPPQVKAFDPENLLVFATGPCAGFKDLAGARWVVCGKSPATTPELFTHCNLGGSWGTELKSAGFDALVVYGKADKPAYLLIEDGKIKIADAGSLWGKGAVQVREILKGELGNSLKVVATGLGGDKMTSLATLLADDDSSGSGSLGAVMGSKKLKAIAVRGSGSVKAAEPQRLAELLDRVAELKRDEPYFESEGREGLQEDHCSGCTIKCTRGVYEAKDGSRGKFMCQSSSFYKEWALEYYGQPNDVPFHATRICDHYGLNTKSIASMLTWLHRCHQAGILTEKSTNLPLTKIGSLEFIQALTGDIAGRRGFGDVLAQGLHRAAPMVGNKAAELLYDSTTRAGELLTYTPKTFITTALLYAMEPRQPIQQLHEVSRISTVWVRWAKKMPNAKLSSPVYRAIAKRFWGSELAIDYSTYEGKALAATMIQDRQLARECLILCDHIFPILYVEHTPDHIGDPSIESKVFSAITGRQMAEKEFYQLGERLMNLQRAIWVREGHRGRESDVLPEACYTVPLESERLNPDVLLPGRNGEVISRKGAVLDKAQFQKILGELYELRGWDQETGFQKKAQLGGLGLQDVAQDLAARGLLR